MTKAIIVAAGMGKRLLPLTADIPKCMLEVAGATLLDRSLHLMRRADISRIAVVRGYCKEKIVAKDVEFFDNPNFAQNNILHSLFCAEEAMTGGFLFSYGDLVYDDSVLDVVLASTEDIAVVVDRDIHKNYIGRDVRAEDEAEVISEDASGVRLIGKGATDIAKATGEFVGIAKFSARGAEILRGEFHRLCKLYEGRFAEPFQRAKEFQKAYMTDMLQELIDRGIRVAPIFIHGGWQEIDTAQDLERARARFTIAGIQNFQRKGAIPRYSQRS